MAINDWWAGEPRERYWMEITDRQTGLGEDLNAPTLNGVGRAEWGYTLVTETRPGDIVLHWHKKLADRPALVGWSEVIGPLSIESGYAWMAHGTRGRARGVPTTGSGWRMALGGLRRLSRPVDVARLVELAPRLREAKEHLARKVRGPLYFPFVFAPVWPVRAAQAYLTKFPAALLQIFPELDVLSPRGHTRRWHDSETGRQVYRIDSRHLSDSKLRKAIEQHAVKRARQLYVDRGATEVVELGKPYDLRVMGLGAERHVEVKGSSVSAAGIELTLNEVAHARNHTPTDLVVVDQIEFRRMGDDYETSGGRLRIWPDWRPEHEKLSPTQFRYDLPPL